MSKAMDSISEKSNTRPAWFVGARFSHSNQTERFVKEGIWKHDSPRKKNLDKVNAIQVGDRIAIKASYTIKKRERLPFDNRGHKVSVMAIKAIGFVKENPGDGHKLKVDWELLREPKKWYFYTHPHLIWRVESGDWLRDNLIDFAFKDKPQDIERFRNEPFWRDRFGDDADKSRFKWTKFYEEMANKLLEYKDNRTPLVEKIHRIVQEFGMSPMKDQYKDGPSHLLEDICPFTVMGIFNRGRENTNQDKRKDLAASLAGALEISAEIPVPESFKGVPTLHHQKSRFFDHAENRKDDDIDALWEVFAQAINLTQQGESDDVKTAFIKTYDNAMSRKQVKWNLTMGLYWIRPWDFLTLDSCSWKYIKKELKIKSLKKDKPPNATEYLKIMNDLKEGLFEDETSPVHTFPELSLAAYKSSQKDGKDTTSKNGVAEPSAQYADSNDTSSSEPPEKYTVDNIVADKCFIPEKELTKFITRLKDKKNIILQGPPGTGKTWLAKRLSFALMGQKDKNRICHVQFHPNLSYEDFVRGWRPAGDGRLQLVDGPLMEMIGRAKNNKGKKFVMVIEEINRGRPAQIFGEMLTLLEADKRTKDEALMLVHKQSGDAAVYIPDNLYIIGTMNIADRSLALVDLALRRRFAFIDLQPNFEERWLKWVCDICEDDSETIFKKIQKRIKTLNETISNDESLGPQYQIGHSYFTPSLNPPKTENKIKEWYHQVVETEIKPLLDEYWFDNKEKVAEEEKKLALEGS